MKILKIIILFIVILSGCSNKYLESSEEEPIGRKCRVLDTEILGQYNVGLVLSLSVKEFVEVRDSVKLKKLYESRRRRNGTYKVLGGCAIAACATYASFNSAFAWMNDPSEDIFLTLAWSYGIVGWVGALYFIINGSLDLRESGIKTFSNNIKNNIIWKNSKPLRDDEVKIMLKNTSSEKTYYTDKNGIIQLKFDEIIPEPSEADSMLNLIIRYEEMVDSVKVRRL